MKRLCLAAFLVSASAFFAEAVFAEAPVEFVPERAVLVLAVDDPVGLLAIAESLPMERLQDAVPAVRLGMMAPQMLAFRGGLMWAEGQLGAGYREVLEVAAGDGLVLGIENEKSIVLVTRSPQPERLPGLLRAIAQLAAGKKVGRDAPAPEPAGNHRGVDAYKIGELAVAVVGESLVLASDGELAKGTIDRLLDGGDQQLWRALPSGSSTSVRMLARHEAIPKIAQQVEQATGPNRDFGQELFFGGVLSAVTAQGVSCGVAELGATELKLRWDVLRDARRGGDATLQETDAATGEVQAEDVSLASIRQSITIHPVYSSGFAVEMPHREIELPELGQGTIAEIAVDRDLALLWSEKDTLLTEEAAARLEVADSQLSTAFGGFDFGDEVLGAIRPTLRLMIFPPANLDAKPPVLPDAALLGGLRVDDPERVARRFRIAWQTVIGIVNVERGGNGQPQLELETFYEDDLKMMTGRYSSADAEELNADSVDLYSSLAPTIATRQEQIVIATSDAIARQVIQAAELQIKDGEGGLVSVALDGAGIAKVLELNRPALLAQNMLEKGHSKAQAESEIGTLIGAVGLIRSAALRAIVHPGGLAAFAKLDWSEKE